MQPSYKENSTRDPKVENMFEASAFIAVAQQISCDQEAERLRNEPLGLHHPSWACQRGRERQAGHRSWRARARRGSRMAKSAEEDPVEESKRTLGRTPPWEITTEPSNRLSSSSLRIASCKWRGMMRDFLLSRAALPANSRISAARYSRTLSKHVRRVKVWIVLMAYAAR